MPLENEQMPAPSGGPPAGRPKPDLAEHMNVPMLLSPPGAQAPVGLTNYTPASKMMHPKGKLAPAGDMNLRPLGPKQMQALKQALMQKRSATADRRPSDAAPSSAAKPEPKSPPKLRAPKVAPKLRAPAVG